ncbi:MAG: mannose-1-phosphate guanylyltransferase [Candidatus Aminicenantales bacterium]
MDIRAIIMAGGAGTRFWPLSRQKKPKQFLPITSEKTMIEETAERLEPLFSPSAVYTVANPEQTLLIRSLLPRIPAENLLIEPEGKNTAPSLILATAAVFLQNPEAVVVALPADHMIRDTHRFLAKLEAGAHAASDGQHLVTFGIPPSHPATGYGYIQFATKGATEISGDTFYPVERFKEKPDARQAEEFLAAGNFYWNSGMFIWQASAFAEKLETFAPAFFPYWERMLTALRTRDDGILSALYREIPSLSIDYALMEKAHPVWMSKGDFGWSDVGSWSSLADIWPKDSHGNALRGETVILDSENCLVHNPEKLTVLVGVKDLIVVETGDALLLCRKDLDQRVKQVVETLKKTGKKRHT